MSRVCSLVWIPGHHRLLGIMSNPGGHFLVLTPNREKDIWCLIVSHSRVGTILSKRLKSPDLIWRLKLAKLICESLS